MIGNILAKSGEVLINLFVAKEWFYTRVQTVVGFFLSFFHVPKLLDITPVQESGSLSNVLILSQILVCLATIGNIVWKAIKDEKKKQLDHKNKGKD